VSQTIPYINGMDFYRRAVVDFPGLAKRIVFSACQQWWNCILPTRN